MRRTWGISVGLLAVVLVACGHGTPTPPPQTAALIKMSPADLSVRLLSNGSGPRVPLRLHLVKGSSFDSSMTINLGLGLTVGGTTLPTVTIPPLTFGMRTVVSDVSASGSTVDFRYTSVNVAQGGNSDVATAMESVGKQLVGLRSRITLDDRGAVLSSGVQVPSGASQQLVQMIDQFKEQATNLSVPFPTEPVGKGARWTVSKTVTLQGTRTTTKLTYVLQELNGNTINLQIISNGIVPDQIAPVPGQPPGTTAHMRRTVITGGGLVLTDLTQPVPQSFDQTEDGTLILDVKQGTKEQRVLEKIALALKIASKPV